MTHEEKPPYIPTGMEMDDAVNCLGKLTMKYVKPPSVAAQEILEQLEDNGSIEEAVCSAKNMINTHLGIVVNLYAVTKLEGEK